jgi:glycosyltransferase involved in cell wall biosynthesis
MYKASIIIPAYNAENYIGKTIDSILAQTFHDYECIIIDDGSTDETLTIVKAYNDPRIKIITQENSGGPAKPRNLGIASAQGEYLFIFDSDDIMIATKLETYVNVFENHQDVGLLFSDFSVINEKDEFITTHFLAEYRSFRGEMAAINSNLYQINMNRFVDEIVKANFIGTSSVCFRRELVVNNLFDERLTSGDDLFAWVRLAEKAKFYFIDEVMHFYRKRVGSISSANTEKLITNKVYVLNLISEQAPKSIREITKKKNEYYLSLGYYFLQKKMIKKSLVAYCKVRGRENVPKIIKSFVKIVFLAVLKFRKS